MDRSDGSDGGSGRPFESVPSATAESSTAPFAMSAAVTVYVPRQIVEARGASVTSSQTIAPIPAWLDGKTWVSSTRTFETGVVRMFVTRNSYGTCWPMLVMSVVVDDFSIVSAGFVVIR